MIMTRFLMLVLLIFSSTSIWLTLKQTPAFNRGLLAETVNGGGRILSNWAMYDPGTYSFQRGYGFLLAAARNQGEASKPASEHVRIAVEALEIATRQDPGNAHAWAALAWAHAQLGDEVGAYDALRVSWQIAPNSNALAVSRLNLAGLLTDPKTGLSEPTRTDKVAIRRDMEVLSRFAPRVMASYLESRPHLAALSGSVSPD